MINRARLTPVVIGYRLAHILKALVAEQTEEISGDRPIRLRQNKLPTWLQRSLQKLYERVKVGALIEHVCSDDQRIGLRERRSMPVEMPDDRLLATVAIGVIACERQRISLIIGKRHHAPFAVGGYPCQPQTAAQF